MCITVYHMCRVAITWFTLANTTLVHIYYLVGLHCWSIAILSKSKYVFWFHEISLKNYQWINIHNMYIMFMEIQCYKAQVKHTRFHFTWPISETTNKCWLKHIIINKVLVSNVNMFYQCWNNGVTSILDFQLISF